MEWFKCYGRLGHLNGCADIGDMIKEGSKILSDVMVQVTISYLFPSFSELYLTTLSFIKLAAVFSLY